MGRTSNQRLGLSASLSPSLLGWNIDVFISGEGKGHNLTIQVDFDGDKHTGQSLSVFGPLADVAACGCTRIVFQELDSGKGCFAIVTTTAT